MRKAIIVTSVASCVLLTSCTALPKTLTTEAVPVSVAEIANAVRCEFALAYDIWPDRADFFERVTTGTSLIVTNTDTSALGASLSLASKPVGVSLTVAPSGGLAHSFERKATLKFDDNMRDYAPGRGARTREKCAPDVSLSSDTRLGLAEYLAQMAEIEPSPGTLNVPHKYEVTFSATRSAGGVITFVLAPVTFESKTNSASLTRSNKLIIDVVVRKPDQSTEAAIAVIRQTQTRREQRTVLRIDESELIIE